MIFNEVIDRADTPALHYDEALVNLISLYVELEQHRKARTYVEELLERNQDFAKEDLFSGMLQGVSLIIKEAVGKGDINEIRMDNAAILIQRSHQYDVASILVTTKISKALRRGLHAFMQQFESTFTDQLRRPGEVSQFRKATPLVEASFPFVPT